MNSFKNCQLCTKILYSNQCNFLNYTKDTEINYILNCKINDVKIEKLNNSTLTLCSTCFGYIKRNQMIYLFNNFNCIPSEICSLIKINNYYIINKIALITMYCKTLKNNNYSYMQQNGNPKYFRKNFQNFMGSVGLIYDDQTIDNKNFNNNNYRFLVIDAIKWLKNNNCLYKKYLSNYEKILNYLVIKSADSLHLGLPMLNSENIGNLEIINSENKFRESGLLISSNIEDCIIPTDKSELNLGCAIKKRKINSQINFEEYIKENINYENDDMEALIFVHLYPYGIGNWFKKDNGLTQNAYFKMRLLNNDPRWRNDKYYIFYAYDTIINSRLLTVNNMLSASLSIKNTINVGNLKNNNYDDYYKYGSFIPKSITGSKTYWKSKYLDLLAIINEAGIADLFITLTSNDSWPGLKKKLQNYDDKCPIHHPVDVSEYFFQRLHLIISQIKKGLLGKCKNYWYRIELQNRGALHVHMIIWLSEKIHNNTISACVPIIGDDLIKSIRDKVIKYQVHKCYENRCFSSGNNFYKKCKYGFPFDLCEEDHFDNNSNTFKYKRINEQDKSIVPYNLALLELWDGHINVQRVTKRGLEQYLVKYISKVEPSYFVKHKKSNTIKDFLELRVVSSLEAAALLCGHHFVQSTFFVKYLNTTINGTNHKFLKTKKELKKLENNDTNIFKYSTYDYYINRPEDELFQDITYTEYFKNYEYIVKDSKKQIPKFAKMVYIDKLGKIILYSKYNSY